MSSYRPLSSSRRTPFIYCFRTIVVLGAHVSTQAKKYLAGIVVVEDDTVVRAASLAAPPDADLARQLEELHSFAANLIEEFHPEHIALKVNEHRSSSTRSVATRAEGVILAAAGKSGLSPRLWYGAGLKKPAGLGNRGSVQECVSALCASLQGADLDTNEVKQAAAAVAASTTEL